MKIRKLKANVSFIIAGLVLAIYSGFISAGTVNINTADANELADAIKGIGIKKAEAIVEYRNKVGNFSSVKDLTKVKGIGEKLLEKNEGAISLGGVK